MALCICCRFTHTNVHQELIQGRIASQMNQLTFLLTPVSLCSAAYLNSGVSMSWLPQAGAFLSCHQFAFEALILVRIPLNASIEHVTFGRVQPWAGAARDPSSRKNLRPPLWGSLGDAKTRPITKHRDCPCVRCWDHFSAQEVYPKGAAFCRGFHVNQCLGVNR